MMSLSSLGMLNSASYSFSMMKTLSSVQNRLQGESNVLQAEIDSQYGNIEKKEEDLAETNSKISSVMGNLGDIMADINGSLNDSDGAVTDAAEADSSENISHKDTGTAIPSYDADSTSKAANEVPDDIDSELFASAFYDKAGEPQKAISITGAILNVSA